MQVRIGLLGTMELWVDGQQLTPGAAKRRTVLAGLALEANRPVSLQRLAGEVWSDPPSSAVANLRSHAAALRQAVGDRLYARPQAYELRLAPGELDVTDFQRLAEEGRSRLSERNPAGAIDALTGAIDQWRGTAGDGLSRGTLLDNHWMSLEEQRLQVFEDLVDAQLAVGAHGDVLRQLIVALYRRGDVPAALVAYRDARAALRDQLGIEPGEELQRLHRAVLERSPELSYEAPAPTVTVREDVRQRDGRGVPRELPAALGAFVGRTREHAEVMAALSGRTSAAVVISGVAGSGKTALTVRVAHAVAADGQVYVDLGYQPSFTEDEVLARVLRALGVDGAAIPQRTSERAGRVRSLLAERRILLVIDGVTHAAQVRALVPAGPGSALIVVTQRHLRSLDGVLRVDLDPLPAEDGRALASRSSHPSV
jgi:DNA-binding SARP family transcriptional activator